mgnify:FL=1
MCIRDRAKRLKKEYGLKFKPCETKHLPISGGDVGGSANFDTFVEDQVELAKKYQLDAELARHFASKYGSNAKDLFEIAQTAQYQSSGLPLDMYTELVYAIRYEMVYKPTDFLVRRTGKLYFNISDVLKYKNDVVKVMAQLLGYTDAQKEAYMQELDKAIDEARTGNDQPAEKE